MDLSFRTLGISVPWKCNCWSCSHIKSLIHCVHHIQDLKKKLKIAFRGLKQLLPAWKWPCYEMYYIGHFLLRLNGIKRPQPIPMRKFVPIVPNFEFEFWAQNSVINWVIWDTLHKKEKQAWVHLRYGSVLIGVRDWKRVLSFCICKWLRQTLNGSNRWYMLVTLISVLTPSAGQNCPIRPPRAW